MRRWVWLVMGCLSVLVVGSGRADRSPAPGQALAPLVRLLAQSDDTALQRDVLRGMDEALQGRRQVAAPEGWAAVQRKLSASPDAEVRQKVLVLSVLFGDREALASLRRRVTDNTVPAEERRVALHTLAEIRPPDLLPLLREMLTDHALCAEALRGLASFKDPTTPELVLKHYASFSDSEKRDAISTLASRPEFASALLDAVERGEVPRRDVSAFIARQILGFNDQRLSEKLTRVWGQIRPPAQDRTALLNRYRSLVAPDALKKADRAHGRLVFSRTCATCHTLFNDGGKIGPDLTGSQRANPDYILSKVLDPSAAVSRDYQVTILETADGRVINGIIKAETDRTVTVQTQTEVVTLPKGDVVDRQKSAVSMMPEGMLGQMSDVEVRDLIAYLAGPSQVPLPATEAGTVRDGQGNPR